MLLFIVIALILYALYSRPHRRIPSRRIQATSAAGRASANAGGATLAASAKPEESAAAQPSAKEPEDGTGASE
jgi:hypothetical protein